MSELGEAVRVSPLIKTARWSLLLVGIWYGHRRYNSLKAKEDEIRAYNARMKPIWDAEKAAAAAKANREQMLILAKEVGVKVSDEDHASVHRELVESGCVLCKSS